VKPVYLFLEELITLLDTISHNSKDTATTRSKAQILLKRILQPDFLCLLCFWVYILTPIDRVQKRLQDKKMNFHEAALDIKALEEHFIKNGSTIISEAIENGKISCSKWNVETEKRKRFQITKEVDQERIKYPSLFDDIKTQMEEAIEILIQEMSERFTRLHDLDNKFGFLLNVKQLMYIETENLEEQCSTFENFYYDDVNGKELYMEICDCKALLRTRDVLNTPLELLEFIVSFGDENVFPNLRLAIQILLTVSVSIASCERSFSKLKLILTYLRATMNQNRLNDLAIISIEEKSNDPTNFDELIDTFSSLKARKVLL
jgi:hypothetical protein